MIRKYEPQDFIQISKIWMDHHIRTHGLITTDFRMHGQDVLQEYISASDIYVLVDDSTDQVYGFAHIVDNIIKELIVPYGRSFRKNSRYLIEYVQKNNQPVVLYCHAKDYELIKTSKTIGFSISKQEVNDFSGDLELVLEWSP